MASSKREGLSLPSRVALLLGAGALSVAAARAEASAPPVDDTDVRVPQQSAKPVADLLIWQDDGRIFIAEAGKPAEELQLGNTAEAELLGRLLKEQGATAQKPHTVGDRIILVGGGGCGFDWTPAGKTAGAPRSRSGAADAPPASGVAQASPPQDAPSAGADAATVAQPGSGKKPVYP